MFNYPQTAKYLDQDKIMEDKIMAVDINIQALIDSAIDAGGDLKLKKTPAMISPYCDNNGNEVPGKYVRMVGILIWDYSNNSWRKLKLMPEPNFVLEKISKIKDGDSIDEGIEYDYASTEYSPEDFIPITHLYKKTEQIIKKGENK